jgi:predicted RNase H-like HicB family nuclease
LVAIHFFNDLLTAYNELGEWARGEKVAHVTKITEREMLVHDQTGPEFAQRQSAEVGTVATLPVDQPVHQYTVLYTTTADGWEATVPDLPGCEAIGDSLEEAQNLIRYFIKTHLQALQSAGKVAPEPKTCAEQVSVAA